MTRYADDHTQGPACAMAAGAATIYRNYLMPVGNNLGQRADQQLDTLADLRNALAERLGTKPAALWSMRNGYALPTRNGLVQIGAYLKAADAATLDELRGLLRVGLHTDVEVTDGPALFRRSRKPSALPCRLLTASTRLQPGHRSRGWSWRRHTNQRC